MANNQDNMQLYLLGQRFLDPLIEADYRKWRAVETYSIMLLGAVIATLSWVALIPMAWWFVPNEFERLGWLLYGVVLPLWLVLTGFGTMPKIRPQMKLIVSFMNMVGGTLIVTANYWIGGAIGAAQAGGMLVLLYAPFMRLPPVTALLASAPYMGLATTLAIMDASQGKLTAYEQMAYNTIPSMGLMTVVLVCAVLEYLLRRSFTREQLILEQQRGLEESRRLIRRYIPPAVADHIVAGKSDLVDTPQRRRVTVLFSDIVGFTDIADRVEPEVMTQVLSEYMSSMAGLIEAHGGTLNEFAGDGLMALFGAPDVMAPEDQVRSAITAAMAMQSKMPELNELWRKLGLGAELKVRIGINTGMVSVGSYGSEGRMTYTAIGLQTNIASRIESAAEPGETLISDASYQLVSGEINCEPKGEVECKGVHFPVKVYAPGSLA